jgi:pimeloyl-ACP methyl ester carboxylesterase
MVDQPERRTVAGLACTQWGPRSARGVVALHGLTSTSDIWSVLAAGLPGHRVVAPDLAGRGGSAAVRVAPGMAGHAAAVVTLVDELGLEDVVLVGHSMGAFLAPLVARSLGDRATRVVLVDGGVNPEPSLLLRRPVVRALFQVQTMRLARRWSSPDAYADAVEGPAVRNRPELRPVIRQWAAHALGDDGRPLLDRRRLVADAVDTLTGTPTLPALRDHPAPVHVLAASAGPTDDSGPFLSDTALERGRAALPRLTSERVTANHVTLLTAPQLPDAVR